jgi:tetratricopeptide (TPR) repeat protein
LRVALLSTTKITNISALAGMPLEQVDLMGTDVSDIRPLLKCPMLRELVLPDTATNVGALHSLPNLAKLSYDEIFGGTPTKTVTEFWNTHLADGITPAAVAILSDESARNPEDSIRSLKVAALEVWFQKTDDFVATCRCMIEFAEKSSNDDDAKERAAKAWCLRTSADSATLKRILKLAREAARAEQNKDQHPWYQQTLGMAEFRAGNDEAAEDAFIEAEKSAEAGNWQPNLRVFVQAPARFFNAMIFLRQGKIEEAKKLFHDAERQMPPLSGNGDQSLPVSVTPDELICWLAYKEAKAFLKIGSPSQP